MLSGKLWNRVGRLEDRKTTGASTRMGCVMCSIVFAVYHGFQTHEHWKIITGHMIIYDMNVISLILPRSMVKNAVAWAKQRGLKRTSEIHGAEEYKVPVDFNFENKGTDRTRTKVSGDFEIQAGTSIPLLMLSVVVPVGRADVACFWEKVLTSQQTKWFWHLVATYVFNGHQHCIGYLGILRKGANTQNQGLAMTGHQPQNPTAPTKGGKKMVFPILQVGGDPFSQPLSYSENMSS